MSASPMVECAGITGKIAGASYFFPATIIGPSIPCNTISDRVVASPKTHSEPLNGGANRLIPLPSTPWQPEQVAKYFCRPSAN